MKNTPNYLRSGKTAKITKTNQPNHGFTIVEVMIFLAVSGLMFVLAAVFINGKQDTVAYRQGMQAAASRINNVVNAVANGEYSSLPDNIRCVDTKDGPSLSRSPESTPQGQHKNCIFLGKTLAYGTNTDKTNYKTFVAMGSQFAWAGANQTNDPVQSFDEANPATAYSDTFMPNVTKTDTLQHGLTYSGAYLCEKNCDPANTLKISGVGFFGSFGNIDSASLNQEGSGAQTIITMPMPYYATTGSDGMVSNINSLGAYGDDYALQDDQFVVLCFARGSSHGSITIGGQTGQNTNVAIQFEAKPVCAGSGVEEFDPPRDNS